MKVCDPCSSYHYLPIVDGITKVAPVCRRISREQARQMCIAYWKRAIEKQGAKHPAINCSNNPKGYITTKELYESAKNDTKIEGYGKATDIYLFYYNRR